KTVNEEHFQDMGKLMFAFIVFWAYIGFSQYMLIWYANMPEGTQFYKVREAGPWVYWSIGLLIVHFIIPFFGVMSKHVKRSRFGLLFWAFWMLFAHWWDMYYMVKPTYTYHNHLDTLGFDLLDLTCLLGVGGFFVFAIGFVGRGRKLVPMKDPRLSESLAFENV
ncbi:MAG: quinol:cytochrome C oxidoreductase, partial [Myxococcota bacterium]